MTVVSVFDYLVIPKQGFDPYAAWGEFRPTLDPVTQKTSYMGDFIDFLVEKGVCDLATCQEDDTVSYMDWIFWKMGPNWWDFIPTRADISAFKPEELESISIRDIELFSVATKTKLFKEAEYTSDIFTMWFNDPQTGSVEEKRMVVFREFNKKADEETVERQGFSVSNVFSNDPNDPIRQFSYSIHLSKKLGYDVTVLNAGNVSGHLLSDICTTLIKDDVKDPTKLPPMTSDVAAINVNGVRQDVRFAFRTISPDSETFKNMLGSINAGMTLAYQIVIGDKNNILPGEEGYDESFIQTMANGRRIES